MAKAVWAPLALYTDQHSIFRPVQPAEVEEQLSGQPAHTQFGRALHKLDIRWIAAHSPQAKGRIERLFATLQDRLVKELRLVGIATVPAANRFLQEVSVLFWEQRFPALPRQARDAHRGLGREHRLAGC